LLNGISAGGRSDIVAAVVAAGGVDGSVVAGDDELSQAVAQNAMATKNASMLNCLQLPFIVFITSVRNLFDLYGSLPAPDGIP